MANYRIRIGYPDPGTFALTAGQGSFALSGQAATLTQSGGGLTFAQNRPSGLTNIVDRQFNSADASYATAMSGTDTAGMAWYSGGGPGGIIATPASLTTTIGATVPALPDANATCLAIKYPSGFSAGEVPFGVYWPGTIAVTQIYMSYWVLMPSNFNSSGNNIKWVFFAGDDSRNHVMMMSSGSPASAYLGPWCAPQGGGGAGYMGGASSYQSGALVNDTTPRWQGAMSTWVLVEHYAKMETSPGSSSDGLFKAWFNGNLVCSWANVKWNAASGDAPNFNKFSFEPYYGGGGSAAPADEYLCVGRMLCAGA